MSPPLHHHHHHQQQQQEEYHGTVQHRAASPLHFNVDVDVDVAASASMESMDDYDSSPNNAVSMDAAFDRIDMGRFQYNIMLAAGLAFGADAMEIMLLSFLSTVLRSEWQLTDSQTNFITASVFAGSFLGTLALGRLGDVWGRRPVFILTASLVSIFGLLTAVVQTYRQLVVCRFVVGIGVGGIGVVFDALAEVMPTARRGARLVYTSFFWTFCTLLVPVLAALTLQTAGWRIFVVTCATPCIVSTVVTLWTVPESPRWLIAKPKNQHCALYILRKAAATNGKDPYVLFPSGTTLVSSETDVAAVNQQQVVVPTAETTTFWDLLSPTFRSTTLLLWAVWGTYALLYYGTIIAVSQVFSNNNQQDNNNNNNNNNIINSINHRDNNNDNLNDTSDDNGYHFDYAAMIIASSAEMVGVVLVLFTVDRLGRITAQTTYFSIGGVVLLALCCLQSVSSFHNDSQSRRNLLVLLAFLARMFVYSGSSVVWYVDKEMHKDMLPSPRDVWSVVVLTFVYVILLSF